MAKLKLLLLSLGSVVFLVSALAHIYVKIKYRPGKDSDIDEIYWEFQDSRPEMIKYNRLCQITFIAALVGLLMLFLSAVF